MTPTKDSRRDSAEQSSKADLFCSNAKCELHRRVGAPGVMRSGNWAVLADGRIIGRGIYGNVFAPEACADSSKCADRCSVCGVDGSAMVSIDGHRNFVASIASWLTSALGCLPSSVQLAKWPRECPAGCALGSADSQVRQHRRG